MATTTIDGTQMLSRPFIGGNEREMAAVLSRSLPSFYRHAFRYLGNLADAEDAVQDALLSAYRHLDQFRGQARMSTWLTAIVINSARMKLRRRARQVHLSLDEHPEQEGYMVAELLPDPMLSPEERCRRSELTETILRSAQQLSPTLQQAFRLRYIDGLTIREMAKILGVVEGTVKARISRARAKVKKITRRRIASLFADPKNCSTSPDLKAKL
jgi:RNA polymerase sigma-70 factor, ECF subfamily